MENYLAATKNITKNKTAKKNAKFHYNCKSRWITLADLEAGEQEFYNDPHYITWNLNNARYNNIITYWFDNGQSMVPSNLNTTSLFDDDNTPPKYFISMVPPLQEEFNDPVSLNYQSHD